jgi:plasmid stability protein
MTTSTITSWKALAEALGIAQNTLRSWRADPTSPSSKDIAEWRLWRDNRLPTQGRETNFEAASIADLKKALLLEQGRKERAIASLRELELKRESECLVPQSEASETIIKTLTPLRRLLDALPRLVAASANPENPMVAELAIRNGLDERVFAEMQKISLRQD